MLGAFLAGDIKMDPLRLMYSPEVGGISLGAVGGRGLFLGWGLFWDGGRIFGWCVYGWVADGPSMRTGAGE
jgi:hypothetical protein